MTNNNNRQSIEQTSRMLLDMDIQVSETVDSIAKALSESICNGADAAELLEEVKEFALDKLQESKEKPKKDEQGAFGFDCDEKVQKIVNQLISEEVVAHDFYVGCAMAAGKEAAKDFKKMFLSIAVDELDDHCKGIAQWATDNGYKVPFKYKDYKKYASKGMFKALDGLKEGLDATEYVKMAIELENESLKSCEDAMAYEDMPYELHSLVINAYYEEQDHLEQLQTLMTAIEANARLAWF